MMSAQEWMPAEALAAPSVGAAIEAAAAAWGRAWLGSERLKLKSFGLGAPAMRDPHLDLCWRVYRSEVAVAVSAKAGGRLTSRALAARPGDAAQTERDKALIDQVERRLLAALAAAVEEAFGIRGQIRAEPEAVENPCRGDRALSAVLADEDGDTILLAIPAAAAVRFRKSRIPRPSAKRPALTPLLKAAAPATVEVEARLGGADLILADLRSLAPGDVLVLDRGLGEPADLVLAGSSLPFARGQIAGADRQLTLTIDNRDAS
jgi:flagellar motor switch/type III secretory pathway protein FliN